MKRTKKAKSPPIKVRLLGEPMAGANAYSDSKRPAVLGLRVEVVCPTCHKATVAEIDYNACVLENYHPVNEETIGAVECSTKDCKGGGTPRASDVVDTDDDDTDEDDTEGRIYFPLMLVWTAAVRSEDGRAWECAPPEALAPGVAFLTGRTHAEPTLEDGDVIVRRATGGLISGAVEDGRITWAVHPSSPAPDTDDNAALAGAIVDLIRAHFGEALRTKRSGGLESTVHPLGWGDERHPSPVHQADARIDAALRDE